MWRPPENESGSARVGAQVEPVAFDPSSRETSGARDSTLFSDPPAGWTAEPAKPPLSIACPADPSGPVHLADYYAVDEILHCPLCGLFTTCGLNVRLEGELFRFEARNPALAPAPPLAEDEATAEALALKLFRAFPGEAVFAAEAAEALATQRLEERLSRPHLARCIALAFERFRA